MATPSTRNGGLLDWKMAIASAVGLSYFCVSVAWYRPKAARVNCKQATLEPVEPMARPASLVHHSSSGTSALTGEGADAVLIATSSVVAITARARRRNVTHLVCREWP